MHRSCPLQSMQSSRATRNETETEQSQLGRMYCSSSGILLEALEILIIITFLKGLTSILHHPVRSWSRKASSSDFPGEVWQYRTCECFGQVTPSPRVTQHTAVTAPSSRPSNQRHPPSKSPSSSTLAMHTSEYDYLFKLLLIGDSGVGKVRFDLWRSTSVYSKVPLPLVLSPSSVCR